MRPTNLESQKARTVFDKIRCEMPLEEKSLRFKILVDSLQCNLSVIKGINKSLM